MRVEGRIERIFISVVPPEVKKPMGGYPMTSLWSARLVEGQGIESPDGVRKDRYGEAKGAYSKLRPEVRQLSLITLDAIERANLGRDVSFTLADTRRNIIISGISAEELNNLLNKIITLGSVDTQGVQLCDPCDRPDHLSGKKGFKPAFTNISGKSTGGLRVRILKTGLINTGDVVVGFS